MFASFNNVHLYLGSCLFADLSEAELAQLIIQLQHEEVEDVISVKKSISSHFETFLLKDMSRK